MSDFKAAPRPKNAVDGAFFRLSAEKLPDGEKRPSLALILLAGGKVRMDVYTNKPGDKKNGNIRQDMDIPTFYTVLDLISRAIDFEPGKRLAYEFKDYIWSGGQKSKDPAPQNKLVIGKNKEGVVFISLVNYDDSRPKIPFLLEIPYLHSLVKDGVPMTAAEGSVIRAKGMVAGMAQLIAATLAHIYVEPEKKGGNGQGGGYGNRGGGQGGGGYQKPAAAQAETAGGDDGFFDDLEL